MGIHRAVVWTTCIALVVASGALAVSLFAQPLLSASGGTDVNGVFVPASLKLFWDKYWFDVDGTSETLTMNSECEAEDDEGDTATIFDSTHQCHEFLVARAFSVAAFSGFLITFVLHVFVLLRKFSSFLTSRRVLVVWIVSVVLHAIALGLLADVMFPLDGATLEPAFYLHAVALAAGLIGLVVFYFGIVHPARGAAFTMRLLA